MDDVRQRIKSTEPELDIELSQILQDNINDLSNAPEPIQIKLYSDDPAAAQQARPRGGRCHQKIPGVIDVENGIDNTISGPATNFQVDPVVASRLGFTPQEVSEDATAILDGIETNNPMIANGRAYAIRVRLGDEHRASLEAIRNTVFNSASGHTASLGSMADIQQLPPQNEILRENLQRMITSLAISKDPTSAAPWPKSARRSPPCTCPPPFASTTAEPTRNSRSRSTICCASWCSPWRWSSACCSPSSATSPRPSPSSPLGALHLRRDPGALVTGTTFNVASFMGLIMVIGIVAKNGILLLDADERYRAQGASARDAMLHAAQRRLRPIVMTAIAAVCGMLPLAFALGAGSQMLQPLAIAVIGGLTVSMVLCLVVTPLVYYLLTRHRAAPPDQTA